MPGQAGPVDSILRSASGEGLCGSAADGQVVRGCLSDVKAAFPLASMPLALEVLADFGLAQLWRRFSAKEDGLVS